MPDEKRAETQQIFTPDGQIANQDVTHEFANALDQARKIEGVPDALRYGYFDAHGNDIAAILTADKVVSLEDSNKRDELTGLPKFKALELSFDVLRDQVKQEKIKGFGIVYTDLDNFSWINDLFEAHSFGNLYLVHVARVLLEHVRTTDVVFRRSGDEFAMLLPDFSEVTHLHRFIDRMQKKIRGVVLQNVFTTILGSHRIMLTPDGNEERQGAYVVRELYTGLQNVQKNKDGRRDHFLTNGRGKDEYKKELLQNLDAVDLDAYHDLTDTKSTVDMSAKEYKAYEQMETQFLKKILPLFARMSMSMGGLVVTRETQGDFQSINNKADRLVYQVKRQGGDQVAIGD